MAHQPLFNEKYNNYTAVNIKYFFVYFYFSFIAMNTSYKHLFVSTQSNKKRN